MSPGKKAIVIGATSGIGYVTKRWRLIAALLQWLPNWVHKRL